MLTTAIKGGVLMAKLGVVMIVLSIIVLVTSLILPGAYAPLASLYCQPGEHLGGDVTSMGSARKSVVATNYTCVDAQGNTHDVTENVTVSTTVAFVLLLLGGMAVTALGGLRASNKMSEEKLNSGATTAGQPQVTTTNGTTVVTWGNQTAGGQTAGAVAEEMMAGLQRGVIRFGGQEIPITDLKSGTYNAQALTGGQHTLAETLRQLEDAHTQGLITDDEYQRLRGEALEKLV